MSRYIDLHAHSTYSMLDGYGKIEQIVERYIELGRNAGTVSDHGNIFAHVPFEQKMRKAGLKPIFGCEFYIVQDMKEKTSRYIPSLGASANPHVTVFAMNQTGYGNLLKLSTLSYEEGYYYKPRIDWTTLQKYQDGLCVLSGCVGGWPSSLIINKSDNDAYSFVTEQRQRIEHFYVEIIPEPGLAESHKTTPILMGIARDLNIPLVMTSDAHFPRPEDHRAQDTMLCIGLGTTMSDTKRYIKLPAYQYYCTERELMDRALQTLSGKVTREISDALIQAMNNTGLIADMCEVEIPKAKPLLFPGVTYPQTADNVLWIAVQEGLQARLQQGRIDPAQIVIYQERAAMEFTVIRDKKFCDYILTVTDICLWAKQQNSIVVCRGSAGGCLLLFLLGCSETDSVMHDLDFSRFLDYTRSDPPDIDIDFQTDMRERVIQYISNTYGKDNVCQILALGTIRAKQAVQDVAAVHGISREKYAPLAAAMDSKDDDVEAQISSLRDPAALAVLKKYPIFNMIDGLVGQCRQSSIHAAGVLISSEPLTNYIAVCRQPNEPVVASVDKYGAAYLNFLKLDALTVSALDVISDTLKAIGANTEWLYRLPFDDVAAYELAMSGKVAGVFQLDGSASRIGAQTRLDSLKELYAASALCRPGASEHVPIYVRNKFNQQALSRYLTSVHPIAASIVAETYGVLLYQEQVMRICRRLALMSDSDVSKFRKRISAAATYMADFGGEYKTIFVDGCKRNNVSSGEIDYWWHAISAHAYYCVSGDTIIDRGSSGNNGGGKSTIAEYYAETQKQQISKYYGTLRPTDFAYKFRQGKCNLLQMDADERVRPARVKNVIYNGKAQTYMVVTQNNKSIRITANHRMHTQRGYVRCDELTLNDSITTVVDKYEGYKPTGNPTTHFNNDYKQHANVGFQHNDQNVQYVDGSHIELQESKAQIKIRANGKCEFCGCAEMGRFEAAHILSLAAHNGDRVAHNSENNLLWLCNSCHKALDYKKGERKKRWSKGRSTYLSKIISITPHGVEDTYCVEMDTKQHNFIANGMVSHNSFNKAHAATYGIVGYWMLYLKAHYPEAYFASFLNREGAASQPNPLLMKRLIREFRQTGGKIILLDPAQSATSFRSIGYNTIVGGWSNIVGIGQSQANSIIANGPYKSWLDARDRIPPTVFYKLYECGITGDLPYSQAGVIELAPWMPVCTIGDTEQRLKAQCNGDSPAILPQGDQIRGKPVMCGYVTAKYKKVRGGHFKGETIIYVLEDTEGAIEFRVSSKQAALASRVKAALKIGDYVALQGWWSGEALFITDYKLLYRRQ